MSSLLYLEFSMLPRGGAGHCGADHCGPGLRLCGPDLTKEEAGTDVHQVLILSTPLSFSSVYCLFGVFAIFFLLFPCPSYSVSSHWHLPFSFLFVQSLFSFSVVGNSCSKLSRIKIYLQKYNFVNILYYNFLHFQGGQRSQRRRIHAFSDHQGDQLLIQCSGF